MPATFRSLIKDIEAKAYLFKKKTKEEKRGTDIKMESGINAFEAGFRDCTSEAIKFLMEKENVSENHPIIHGLKQYLSEKQQEIFSEQQNESGASDFNVHSYPDNALGDPDSEIDISVNDSTLDEGYSSLIHDTSVSLCDTSREHSVPLVESLPSRKHSEMPSSVYNSCSQSKSSQHSTSMVSLSTCVNTSPSFCKHGFHSLSQPTPKGSFSKSSQSQQSSSTVTPENVNSLKPSIDLNFLTNSNPDFVNVAHELIELLREELKDEDSFLDDSFVDCIKGDETASHTSQKDTEPEVDEPCGPPPLKKALCEINSSNGLPRLNELKSSPETCAKTYTNCDTISNRKRRHTDYVQKECTVVVPENSDLGDEEKEN